MGLERVQNFAKFCILRKRVLKLGAHRIQVMVDSCWCKRKFSSKDQETVSRTMCGAVHTSYLNFILCGNSLERTF